MNEINIRRAINQTPVNNPVELVSEAVVVKTKKYPNRSRKCVACNHACAKVYIIKLSTKDGEYSHEFGEDCMKTFLGKKSKKNKRNTDGINTRQFTVICSNTNCTNMNLKSRCRFNNIHSTRHNCQDWFINPYVCDSCDRVNNPRVNILIDRQADIENNYIKICNRFGKNINPIDNSTFYVQYINYTNSNFNIKNINPIMLLLENVKKYPNNSILLHKFILYYISKSRDDEKKYISLQFLPRKLVNWWLGTDYNYILRDILGIKKCIISDDEDD